MINILVGKEVFSEYCYFGFIFYLYDYEFF